MADPRLPSSPTGAGRDARSDLSVLRNPTVAGLSLASFFSDLGHEMATAVLPGFLRSIGAPAVALGAIESVADASQSFAKLAGGVAADRVQERRRLAAAGYATTGLGTGALALAGPWPVLAVFRALAWGARGFRSPARDSLLGGAVAAEQRGRAFGLERAMDSAGAVVGPLVAAALLGSLSFRGIFVLSIFPALLAATAVWTLARETPRRVRAAVRPSLREVPRGPFRTLVAVVGLYGLAHFAPTLLVLHATDLLRPGRGLARAAALAVLLYSAYNLAQSLAAYPAGAIADRVGHRRVLAAGVALFGAACVGFGVLSTRSPWALGVLFAAAGASTSMVETAQKAYATELVRPEVLGRAFGILGVVDGVGDLISSLVVGALFTVASAGWGFAWGAALSLAGLAVLILSPRRA
jgi:MFS family permease